jgi:hypothetical protein
MGKPHKCEWCGQLLYGTCYRGHDKEGAHGYFCSPKCVDEAAREGFRGTPHTNWLLYIIATPFALLLVAAIKWISELTPGEKVLLGVVAVALVGVVLLLVMLVRKGIGGVGSATKENAGSAPPVIVSVRQLLREYKANAVAANDRYLDKLLEVTGKVEKIEEEQDSLHVSLKGKGVDVAESLSKNLLVS